MHLISVWFVCKLCRSSFQQVSDLIKHKFESHFEQFKSVKHIIFEEKCYHDDFDFPDGDQFTKSKPFNDGQVDWDHCLNRIQRRPFPPNNIAHFKPDDTVFEDKKPFTYSSSNSNQLDNIDSRAVSFTIQQDSVIINVGTLDDLDSDPTPEQTILPRHIDKENQVCNAARIKNPFVLLRRMSNKEIESAKLIIGNTQCISKFNSDLARDIYPIDSAFDQRSLNSDNAGPSTDCEIGVDLDVKPFNLNEESTIIQEQESPYSKTSFTRQLTDCHGVSDLKRRRLMASSPGPTTHGSNDHLDCGATSSVNLLTTASFDAAKNKLSLKPNKIIDDISSESLGHDKVESTIPKHTQFSCPHRKCKTVFKTTTSLARHVNYYHGDLERRRVIASGCPTYEKNDDEKICVEDISELALGDWLIEEGKTCNKNGNPNVIRLDPDPTTINRGAAPISLKNPIKCKLCSKKLVSEASVKFHVSTCWFNNKQIHRYCVPCGFSFDSSDRLKRHNFRLHLSMEEKLARAKYMCDHCPKIFEQESEFTTHKKTHESQDQLNKPFVCQIGGFTCTSMGILETHNIATTHSNYNEPFKCPYTHCGIFLKSRRGRQIHLRVVHFEAWPFN